MRDKYTDAIRIGKVSSIDPANCTAQVTFEDRHGIVSRDLPIVVPCTLLDHWYYMPDIGERVRVLFDPEAPTKGCILGSYYSDGRSPPIKDADKAYVQFMDSTLVEYDRALHKLTIKIPAAGPVSIEVYTASDVDLKTDGFLKVKAAKDVNIESENATVNIDAAKDIIVTAKGNMRLKADGDMELNAGGNMTLYSSKLNLNP